MSDNHHDIGEGSQYRAAAVADPNATIARPGYCSYGYYHYHANLRPDNHRPPHTPADQGPTEHPYSPEAISDAVRHVLEEYRGVEVDEGVLVGLVQQRLRGSAVAHGRAHGSGYRTRVRVSWTGAGTGTGERREREREEKEEEEGEGKDVVVETRQV